MATPAASLGGLRDKLNLSAANYSPANEDYFVGLGATSTSGGQSMQTADSLPFETMPVSKGRATKKSEMVTIVLLDPGAEGLY